jgi:uncharacterized RDD family membrane protein YckC
METKQTPLALEGVYDNIYAGFGQRLGSMLLDFVFVLPVSFAILYANRLGLYVHLITLVPSLVFSLWYHVYLTQRNGGTPGKTVINLKIIRIDGNPIGWREAILRHIVLFGLTLVSTVMMVISVFQADPDVFNSLDGNWLKQAQYLNSFHPNFNIFYLWATNIWVYSELIVMLTNKRKRAIHDYIAGTVIVQAKYAPKIWDAMYQPTEPQPQENQDNNGITD